VANHKSALKRHRQSQIRRMRNRVVKTQVKNAIREVNEAISGNTIEAAQDALKAAVPVIAKASVKGTLHKKTASRKISRLTRRVNAFVASTQEAS